ncbi:MAG: TerB family tellurite resistance protein [Crocinitomicaceae bacterium]|nr:TerB family tellurite resistance protein [Crocinitomicaceae bacterium]
MDEKRSLISELIALSKIDGYVSENESGLIKQMGNLIGLSDKEILDLFEHPAPFKAPAEHIERITQFHRMVLMANVDHKVENSEIEFLKFAGIKLGLNEQAINEVLNRMSDFPDNVIPPDELISIYKKHMN